MKRPRDSQRSRVYRTGWDFEDLLPDLVIRDIREIQAWVDEIVSDDLWINFFTFTSQSGYTWRVTVKDGRGRRSAVAIYGGTRGRGTISLPRSMRHRVSILHELAHLTTSSKRAAHDPKFVQAWLILVDFWIGKVEGMALRWFLTKNRVRWQKE